MSANAFKETGTLPVGVEVDGKLHREFTLRPRLVRDSVEAQEIARAQTNDSYRGAVLIAAQLEKLGDLPREKITTELLLELFDVDMGEILKANARLEVRLATFRGQTAGAAQAASGAGEDRGAMANGA